MDGIWMHMVNFVHLKKKTKTAVLVLYIDTDPVIQPLRKLDSREASTQSCGEAFEGFWQEEEGGRASASRHCTTRRFIIINYIIIRIIYIDWVVVILSWEICLKKK